MREPVEALSTTPYPRQDLLDSAKISISEAESLITGTYTHELTLYRARKLWEQVLESYFLLDKHTDFLIKTRANHETGEYSLWCFFTSACGRYACWRIAHDHAPEALAMIEVAHIPQSASKEFDRISAPNASIKPISRIEKSLGESLGIMDTIKKVLAKIVSHQNSGRPK
jgi:hypothetical protein